jgi:hypothetical protein
MNRISGQIISWEIESCLESMWTSLLNYPYCGKFVALHRGPLSIEIYQRHQEQIYQGRYGPQRSTKDYPQGPKLRGWDLDGEICAEVAGNRWLQ